MDLRLKRALKAVADDEDLVIAELERLYPEGKNVDVFLRDGQIYPSGATVIGHDGGRWGYVRVRLHAGKQSMKRVTPDNILNT